MAIERTTINGDMTVLKTALETLIPEFFASVEQTQDTFSLNCKDADGNTLLRITRSSNNVVWTPYIYRDANSYLYPAGSNSGASVKYFYKCGANGAVLTLGGNGVIVIAKDRSGKTAVVIPSLTSGTYASNSSSIYAACWGDDPTFRLPIVICTSVNGEQATGNYCLFVPVPLYGTYDAANYIPKLYMMPMTQANMRGVEQIITDADGSQYFTNGYLALKDEGGDA